MALTSDESAAIVDFCRRTGLSREVGELGGTIYGCVKRKRAIPDTDIRKSWIFASLIIAHKFLDDETWLGYEHCEQKTEAVEHERIILSSIEWDVWRLSEITPPTLAEVGQAV